MGTVKLFNESKGYGFIKPDAGGPDVSVHISAVEEAGYTGLAEGAQVSYELVTGRSGRGSAENLRSMPSGGMLSRMNGSMLQPFHNHWIFHTKKALPPTIAHTMMLWLSK
jgi:CspA family cold shock protein